MYDGHLKHQAKTKIGECTYHREVSQQLSKRSLNLPPQTSPVKLTCSPYGGFLKWGYPQIINLNRNFSYKAFTFGVPPFQEPPYSVNYDLLRHEVTIWLPLQWAGIFQPFNPGRNPEESSSCLNLNEMSTLTLSILICIHYDYNVYIYIYIYLFIYLYTYSMYIYICVRGCFLKQSHPEPLNGIPM